MQKELSALQEIFNKLGISVDTTLIRQLKDINEELWQIEDKIREMERNKSFGETFVRLARSVYRTNDRRSAVKKQINTIYKSTYIEEKSYKDY